MTYLRYFIRNFSNISRGNIAYDAVHKQLLNKRTRSLFKIEKKNYAAYEGDGKTVGYVINKKESSVLTFNHVTQEGFTLTNGKEFVGSLIIFPHAVVSWHVDSAENVTEESLTLFKLLDPKLDILIFGFGTRDQFPPEARKNFHKICKKLDLRYEALPTHQAIGLFNFLADDRRFVAAALIPPRCIDYLKLDRKKSYFIEDGLDEEEEEEEKINLLPADKPKQIK